MLELLDANFSPGMDDKCILRWRDAESRVDLHRRRQDRDQLRPVKHSTFLKA